ncbi:MAG: TonB family protein [Steroidobacteraceae bacterium]
MSVRRSLSLTCAALLALAAWADPARSAPPVPDVVRDADVAMGYDAKGRCPQLMHADPQDRSAALVVLLVGPTGVPSRASIKSSSGSQSLDAAALSCVQQLRFLPAVHAGDGNAIDSWQEIAWKWGRFHTETAAPAPAATAATAATAARPAEARVCLDASGRLAQAPVITRSSGDAGLDAAALNAARSAASGSYARGGCLRFAVTPDGTSHDGAR